MLGDYFEPAAGQLCCGFGGTAADDPGDLLTDDGSVTVDQAVLSTACVRRLWPALPTPLIEPAP